MKESLSYQAFVMAIERVEQRLRTVTAALDAASIRYAVIGGNAVAVRVSKADPAATRRTSTRSSIIPTWNASRSS